MLTPESRQLDFPSLSQRTYLNTAAEGIPPTAVGAALNEYFADKLLGMDGRIAHQAKWDALRQTAAELIGGLSATDIGLCSCSSEAYNLIALALRLRDGDEVVINDLDFPAGATPWLQAACPATVKVWRARDGALRIDDLLPLLSQRTRFVNTSWVSFFNGAVAPVSELVPAIRARCPALIGLDVTQALGRVPHVPTDVDVIVSSTHKWILGSHGGGIVAIPPQSRERWNIPAGGWFHLEDAFGDRRFERAVSRPGAVGFGVGMPNYPAVYAVNAALNYIRDVSVEAIAAAADPLATQVRERLGRLNVELLTPIAPAPLAGIVAFRHPASERIHAALHAQGIHVMMHAGRVRIAVHGYNTQADIDRFFEVLEPELA
ncbi:MAG: aminotransferase class V-fold PLP-dependent enzyme [Planctomycetales bacterium]|nr:aminotransferase class V-fold PLP-dependent enzyme [Planctomycetales bacterium]